MNPSKNFQALSTKYGTPKKIQQLLRSYAYNDEGDGETAKSALQTYRLKKAHCLEATVLAAAIGENLGYPPLLLSLDSSDNLNHTVYVFKEKTGWGSIGRSRIVGLHGREPTFRSIRDLVWSYCDPFVDATGSLIGYALQNLDESGTDWRYSKKNLWKLEKFVVNARFQKIKISRTRYQKELKRYQKEGCAPTGDRWW